MQLITANLFCFNPWQRAAIQQLLTADADILVLPEVKPTLLHWLREVAERQGYTVVTAQTNKRMTLCLLSRLPITQHQLITQGSFGNRPQIRVELTTGVTLFGIHLMAPITRRKHKERNAQLSQLAAMIGAEGQPAVAAGDFNTTHHEKSFQPLLQIAVPAPERPVTRPKSWPALLPLASLDHIIHNRQFRLEQLKQGNFNGSDHLPVMAQLAVNR